MAHPVVKKAESEIAELAVPVRALWHAAHGNWDHAHELVQDDPSRECAWVHAYLHRVEGDNRSAQYWYHRAGQPVATGALEQELHDLLTSLAKA